MPKEAHARIKINKLLEAAGWRFFDSSQGKANIALEPNVKLSQAQVDAMGNDFDTTSNGFIDFLLLDDSNFPLVVLEAKAENKNPLIGKEQARKYAKSQNCRFVILSNGNLHYLWDLPPDYIARTQMKAWAARGNGCRTPISISPGIPIQRASSPGSKPSRRMAAHGCPTNSPPVADSMLR